MAKTTYYAVAPNGTIRARKTDRTYTNVVFVQNSIDNDLGHARTLTYFTKEAKTLFARVALGLEGYVAQGLKNHAILGREYFVESFAKDQAIVAKHGTAEAMVEDHRATLLAKIERDKAEGHYDMWIDLGWCGRPDLARKLSIPAWACNTTIVEVSTSVPAAKAIETSSDIIARMKAKRAA